jgi:hypothetical protein
MDECIANMQKLLI